MPTEKPPFDATQYPANVKMFKVVNGDLKIKNFTNGLNNASDGKKARNMIETALADGWSLERPTA